MACRSAAARSGSVVHVVATASSAATRFVRCHARNLTARSVFAAARASSDSRSIIVRACHVCPDATPLVISRAPACRKTSRTRSTTRIPPWVVKSKAENVAASMVRWVSVRVIKTSSTVSPSEPSIRPYNSGPVSSIRCLQPGAGRKTRSTIDFAVGPMTRITAMAAAPGGVRR